MLPSNRRERNNSLSPVMPGRRSGDSLSMRLQGSQTRVNSRICGRKVGTSRDDCPDRSRSSIPKFSAGCGRSGPLGNADQPNFMFEGDICWRIIHSVLPTLSSDANFSRVSVFDSATMIRVWPFFRNRSVVNFDQVGEGRLSWGLFSKINSLVAIFASHHHCETKIISLGRNGQIHLDSAFAPQAASVHRSYRSLRSRR
jgi:hypothetical protein